MKRTEDRRSVKIEGIHSSYFLYIIYFAYMLFVNIILFILNYYSIISFTTLSGEIIYLGVSVISVVFGIYYTIYKHESKIDFNKTLRMTASHTAMIWIISIFILYLAFFIGLKFNLFTEYLIKWDSLGIVNKVYCEGSSGDTSGGSNNINSKLKSPDEGKISSAPQESSKSYFSSSTNINNNIVATDNSTISNVNINPGQSSAERTPYVKNTTSKKEVITTTFLSDLKSRLKVKYQYHREESTSTTVYGPQVNSTNASSEEVNSVNISQTKSSNNSFSSNLSYYYNNATGIFQNPLKGHSADNSLRLTGKTLKESPLVKEGIAGIISNLDLYKDMPVARTQNNTPLSQLSDLPYLNQVSPIDEEVNELALQEQSKSELPYLNESPVASVQSGGVEGISKWSHNSTISLNKNKDLPAIPCEGLDNKSKITDRILSLFGKGKKVSVLPVNSSQKFEPVSQQSAVAQVIDSSELSTPNSGVYDLNYSKKGNITKRSKSLPDLHIFKKSSHLPKDLTKDDYKYINHVFKYSFRKADPSVVSEYFNLPDNNYMAIIKYECIRNKNNYFVLLDFGRSRNNFNQFKFEIIPAKTQEELVNYLINSGNKYSNKELMIEKVQGSAAENFVSLFDIKSQFNYNKK